MNRIIDLHNDLMHADTAHARWVVSKNALSTLGVEWLTAGTAPRIKLDAVNVCTSLPTEIMGDYVAAGLPKRDFWMHHCANSNTVDQINVEAPVQSTEIKRVSLQFEVFSGHRLRQVCLVPTYGGHRPGALVFYAKGREEAEALRSEKTLAALRAASAVISVYWRPEDNHDSKALAVHNLYEFNRLLSQRERESLLWLANGFQSARIAQKMGVEPVTVAKHLFSARRKLGARTREQALAMAIKYRLIQP